MKYSKISLIIATLISLFSISELNAQNAHVRNGRHRAKNEKKESSISQRAKEKALDLKHSKENYRWEKVVYRMVKIRESQNAVLAYVGLEENAENLFTKIFRLINTGQIKAYEYLDGKEIFTDKYLLDFPAFLDRFQVPYTKGSQRRNSQTLVKVEANDVPSSEVEAYYVKELWYFDQAKSDFNVRIEAICPILFRSGDYQDLTYPLFWISYESLRPYINNGLVMLSDENNHLEATLDDFFTMQIYKGEIVKVQNLLNQSLVQQVGENNLKAKQDSIEQSLKRMQEHSYVSSPMIRHKASQNKAEGKMKRKVKKSSSSRSVRGRF